MEITLKIVPLVCLLPYCAEGAHLLQHTVDIRHDILPIHQHRGVGPVP